MSLQPATLLRAAAKHRRVARVVVAEVKGSAPREVGAAMLVWNSGQDGTIGGGMLEFQAIEAARQMLASGDTRRFSRHPLGPDMGQCCGGAVALLCEVYDAATLAGLGAVHARPVRDDAPMPLAVQRLLAAARGGGEPPAPALIDGWFVEPVAIPTALVWIWGAGHVGRALVATLAPLSELAITWLDTDVGRFPDDLPEAVTALPAPELLAAVTRAPADAHHLIVTYSHALDLALCDKLLRHGFASAGLIGSDTKAARFRSRLRQIGHTEAAIAGIDCPIGDKRLGKHPQAIAVGVAAALLLQVAHKKATGPAPGDEGDGDDRSAADA